MYIIWRELLSFYPRSSSITISIRAWPLQVIVCGQTTFWTQNGEKYFTIHVVKSFGLHGRHRQLNCLFKNLFRLTTTKTLTLHNTGLFMGIPRSSEDSLHKGPVIRKSVSMSSCRHAMSKCPRTHLRAMIYLIPHAPMSHRTPDSPSRLTGSTHEIPVPRAKSEVTPAGNARTTLIHMYANSTWVKYHRKYICNWSHIS